MATEKMPVTTNAVIDGAGFLAVIERAAINPDVDVEKMQRLLDMQERILNKNAEIGFNQAMARLQPVLPVIEKKTKGHNSKYAKYEDIEQKVRPLYTEEGFSLSFDSKRIDDTITYYGTLSHVEGFSKTAQIDLPGDKTGNKNDIQAKASTLTYAKRYLISMLLNIVTVDEDDDGHKGGTKTISPTEIKVLEDMIKRSGADREKFLGHLGVRNLEDLPDREFKKAETALQAKMDKK